MGKLPQISGREAIKALQKIGFVTIHQKGSHVKVFRKSHNQTITIPLHKTLKKGTLRNGILKLIPLSVDELIKLLKK